jgi:8-oxo-dGTP diphosphatase
MKRRDVSVLVLGHDGRILLQKRSKTASRFPGSWGLFGGGLQENEWPLEALKREILEELGLALLNPIPISSYPYMLDEYGEMGTVHAFAELYDGKPLSLKEGDEMLWTPPRDALSLDLHPIYKQILEHIVQGQISVLL